MSRRAVDPAARGGAAALRAAPTSGSERLAFELEVTPAFIDAVAERVVGLLRVEQEQHQQQDPQWLNVEQAARHLACSKDRIYRLVHLRRIPHEHEGQRLLFDRLQLDEWVRMGGGGRVA